MQNSTELGSISIPALTQYNFKAWHTALLLSAELADVGQFYNGPVPPPADDPDPAVDQENKRTHRKKEYLARTMVAHTTLDMADYLKPYGYDQGERLSHAIYDIVVRALSTTTEQTASDTLVAFYKLDLANFDSPSAFIKKFLTYVDVLDASKYRQTDEAKAVFLAHQFMGINPNFFTPIYLDVQNNKTTYVDVLRRCSELHGNQTSIPKSLALSSTSTNWWTQIRWPDQPECTKCNRRHPPPTGDRYVYCDFCKICHKGGIDNCFLKHPELKPNSTSATPNTASTATTTSAASPRAGNMASGVSGMACTFQALDIEPEEVSEDAANISEPSMGYALNSVDANTSTDIKNTVILDSGTSHHKFNDHKWFTHIRRLEKPIQSLNANASVSYQEFIGTVCFDCELVDGRTITVTLNDALYLPHCPVNLVSNGALIKKGAVITNDSVTPPGSSNALAIVWENNVSTFKNALPCPVKNSAKSNISMAAIDYKTMHQRLMHASSEVVHTACQRAGIKLQNQTTQCDTCSVAKSTEIISRRHADPVQFPGQLVRLDLIECPPGHRDLRYFIHYIDQHSGYQWVHHAQRKNQAFDCIKRFVAHFERQTPLKIQALGLDGGTEFGQATTIERSSKLTTWAREAGIQLLVTTPHTPSSNGRAERAGRSLLEKARASMLGANIPENLWPFAVDTAALISNLLPTKANPDSMAPQERFFSAIGLPPDQCKPYIDHLRAYGCKAFVHVKAAYRDNKDKFSGRAEVGKLVGYDSKHGRIYYVWFPDTGRVRRVSSVRFHEVIDTTAPFEPPIEGDVIFEENNVHLFTLPASPTSGAAASGADTSGAAEATEAPADSPEPSVSPPPTQTVESPPGRTESPTCMDDNILPTPSPTPSSPAVYKTPTQYETTPNSLVRFANLADTDTPVNNVYTDD